MTLKEYIHTCKVSGSDEGDKSDSSEDIHIRLHPRKVSYDFFCALVLYFFF